MLLAWLDNPEATVGLDGLADRFFSHKMIKFKDTVKRGEDFSQVLVEEAASYASEDARFTLKLFFLLSQKLHKQEPRIYKEFFDVEMPFMRLLLELEQKGVAIDRERLKELQVKNDAEIERIKSDIFTATGYEFNINSTKQLSDILFERLGLKSVKKTKTGLSTDERSLQKMIDAHPVIDKILLYREVFKPKAHTLSRFWSYRRKMSRTRYTPAFYKQEPPQAGYQVKIQISKSPKYPHQKQKRDGR